MGRDPARLYARGAATQPHIPDDHPMSRLPRIALAQMEVRAGRPDLNLARMLEMMAQARDRSVRVICGPGGWGLQGPFFSWLMQRGWERKATFTGG